MARRLARCSIGWWVGPVLAHADRVVREDVDHREPHEGREPEGGTVNSIRRWWNTIGRDRFPDATRLVITADAGGSNGYRPRSWKWHLAQLAAETGLRITVCHYPPGTSKWNRIAR